MDVRVIVRKETRGLRAELAGGGVIGGRLSLEQEAKGRPRARRRSRRKRRAFSRGVSVGSSRELVVVLVATRSGDVGLPSCAVLSERPVLSGCSGLLVLSPGQTAPSAVTPQPQRRENP